MKPSVIATLFLCLVLHQANAQFLIYGKEDAIEFQSRPLLVIENKTMTAEFKEIIQQEWKVKNPSMKFVSPEEADVAAENSPGVYSYLWMGNGTLTNRINDKIYEIETMKMSGYYHKKGKTYPKAFQVPFMYYPLTALDVRLGVRQFNIYITALAEDRDPEDPAKDVQTLLKKTLLVPKEVVEPPFGAKELGVDYAGKIEVKPWENILEIINSRDSSYAFVYNIVQANGFTPSWIVVDNANYDILALVGFGGLYFGVGGVLWKTGKKPEYLKPRDVKYFGAEGAQKLNRRKIKAL